MIIKILIITLFIIINSNIFSEDITLNNENNFIDLVDIDNEEITNINKEKNKITKHDTEYKNIYFPKERETLLTEKDKIILQKVDEYNNKHIVSNPLYNPDGSVQFIYGLSFPNIICTVLEVTDVELQVGEIINSVSIGDSARWRYSVTLSNSPLGEIPHLIIKPLDIGINTSIVITTNRRTYRLKLKSISDNFMPYVNFSYPEESLTKRKILKEKKEEYIAENTIPETNEYLGDLDFNYKITGKAKFKPTRVYNNSEKTIIEMPENMKALEAPTLLVVRKDGGFLRKEDRAIVNYRLQNNRYIVDSLFDKCILISGVGRGQDKIVIERIKNK